MSDPGVTDAGPGASGVSASGLSSWRSARDAALALDLCLRGVSLLAIGLLTLWVYAPAVGMGYALEDVPPEPIVWANYLAVPVPRMLTGLTLAIAPDVHVQHAISLAVHVVNTVLIWVLLGAVGVTAQIVGAGLWALAPIQSESVLYLAARADLLLVTCALAACLSRRGAWFWCLCAVLVKETGIVVPGLVLLARWGQGRPLPWRLMIGGLLVSGALAWRFLPRLYTWAHPSSESPLWYAAIQVAAVGRLLLLTVWPVGLTVDHDWDAISHLTAACCVSGLVGLVTWARLTRSWRLGFALAWVIVALAPRFFVPQAEWVAEHHLPIALVGPVWAFSTLFKEQMYGDGI